MFSKHGEILGTSPKVNQHCLTCGSLISSRIVLLIVSSVDPPFDGARCKLASPHSNAIIDLNGDCLAGQSILWKQNHTHVSFFSDIFLVCDEGSGRRSFQIWVNNKQSGFSLAQHQSLPSGVQAITFADIGKSIGVDADYAPMHTL